MDIREMLNEAMRLLNIWEDDWTPKDEAAWKKINNDFSSLDTSATPPEDARELARSIYTIASQGEDEWLHKFDAQAARLITAYADSIRKQCAEICDANATKWRELIALGGARSNWRGVGAHEDDARDIRAKIQTAAIMRKE